MKIAFQLKPRLLLWRTCGALSCEKHEKHEKQCMKCMKCMKPESRTHQTAEEAPNPATLQRVVVSAGVEIIVHSNNGGADGSISATSDGCSGCSSGGSGVSGMLAAVGGTKCGKSPAKMVT